MQERVFEKVISQDMHAYESLDFAVPYIIGDMTRHKFMKLLPFQDHMLSLDPEADKVRSECGNSSDKLFQYYRQEWASTIKKSSRIMRVNPKLAENLTTAESKKKSKKASEVGPLYPYQPHTDCGYHHEFSEYDVLWSNSLLCKPGKQSFFLVYKYDNERVLKAHFSSYVPIRPH